MSEQHGDGATEVLPCISLTRLYVSLCSYSIEHHDSSTGIRCHTGAANTLSTTVPKSLLSAWNEASGNPVAKHFGIVKEAPGGLSRGIALGLREKL